MAGERRRTSRMDKANLKHLSRQFAHSPGKPKVAFDEWRKKML